MILHEKTKQEFGYDFATSKVYDQFYCVCDYCGKEFLRSKRNICSGRSLLDKESCNLGECVKKKREESSLVKYGVKNAGGSKESLEKIKAANLRKFGVENPMHLEEIKDKVKETNKKKYGKPSYLATDECRKKLKSKYDVKSAQENAKATCRKLYGKDWYSSTDEAKQKKESSSLKKYNVKNVLLSDGVKNKIRNTMLGKYGVTSPLQNKKILDKAKNTCKERYGEDNFLKTEEGKEKVRQTIKDRYGVNFPLQNQKLLEKSISTKIEKYGTPYPNCFGKTQLEIKNWVNSLGFNFNSSSLEGKELDLYDADLRLAIEYCGLYWHNEMSPQPRTRQYHYNKYKSCLKNNIRLITIFEDEWVNKQDICKNILKCVLGKTNRRIFGRNCCVKEIAVKVSNDFYDKNHLLGSCKNSLVSFGLFYNDELVGSMTLGKHHRNKDVVVLSRLCFLNDVHVSGGANKLLKSCLNWSSRNHIGKLITWSDNRWSSGNVYGKMGFVLDKELPPDYSYVDLNKKYVRRSKQSQKKKKDSRLSEREECLLKKMVRIWDCGKKRWTINL